MVSEGCLLPAPPSPSFGVFNRPKLVQVFSRLCRRQFSGMPPKNGASPQVVATHPGATCGWRTKQKEKPTKV